jgi:uncharacterized protein
MSFSLFQATVPSFLQILGSVAGLLDKAETHCTSKGLNPEVLIHARLAEDMKPFAYQVKSVAVHSKGAIDGLRKGVFSPDLSTPPADFAGLRSAVAEARAALAELEASELDGFVGKPMRFQMGDFRMDFTAENFLLSFSQPNFYFHATTAYDILRWKGLAIGKMDFLGQLRKSG